MGRVRYLLHGADAEPLEITGGLFLSLFGIAEVAGLPTGLVGIIPATGPVLLAVGLAQIAAALSGRLRVRHWTNGIAFAVQAMGIAALLSTGADQWGWITSQAGTAWCWYRTLLDHKVEMIEETER